MSEYGNQRTIAAISTPEAPGGIAVLRLSGEDAFSIGQRCFRSSSGKAIGDMAGYTCAYGTFLDANGADLDDGIVTVFRAPHSYTGENVVEFSCHGGLYITRCLLESLLHAGADAAQPGEFTQRAFLAGKMTLTQAEAVMDVIGATGERELRFAHAEQRGALFQRVQKIKDQMVHCLGDLAAWADYPEEEIPAVTPEQLKTLLKAVEKALKDTLSTYHYGKILQSGVSAVIVGKPNVGKSTLFNLLSGCQRSIVTDIAGTTRDVVEERVQLGDVTLRLWDTAGLRETSDAIEKIGVKLAQNRLQDADLILAVFDGSMPLELTDFDILKQLPQKPMIAIVNKSDQKMQFSSADLAEHCNFSQILTMSAKCGDGLELLQNAIEQLFYNDNIASESGIVSNTRQKKCIEEALQQIRFALDALEHGKMLDGVTILIEEGLEAILTLTGERVSETVVDDVFSRFCVGK
ncbi:MAG: tRNA uridine-5-carboxymethylaminomethyl(34) synthesis GTPase MnmE [Ruminococcus sp.]|nr:tRNA uridine-5-carboxymethylaminomethyl(34) synthesis GTPase MnmE [Ruminococcus sp.]